MKRARGLLERVSDHGSLRARADDLVTRDPLRWPDYPALINRARASSGTDESVVTGSTSIGGHEVEIAAFDFGFMGGSMGEISGERIARGLERAAERGVSFVLLTATGGARMQEGMRALAQMPKLVAARLALSDAGAPLIALLGNPTTGGVLASIGGLADLTAAVGTRATIGFAGPRLVKRFTGASLGPGSHTGASAMEHGLVDAVVSENEERRWLRNVLDVLAADAPISLERREPEPPPSLEDDPWQVVERARGARRPRGPELAVQMSDTVVELHGDRAGTDDPALTTALCRIGGRRAFLLALDRNHHPGPGAYRKARRCLRLADRLHLPVVTLVDTPGADPSERSEAGGIAWEIAATIEAMLSIRVPILSLVTGVGGSGGALALSVGDTLLAHRDSIFSVISPEAAAEILWREPDRGPEAARLLRLTANDLIGLGIADGAIAGRLEGASLAATVAYHLDLLRDDGVHGAERAAARRRRWRSKGGP
jgi:acetyl-CoA carboxylase beta subunit/acetyl-CoA carboxylase alpha subunit